MVTADLNQPTLVQLVTLDDLEALCTRYHGPKGAFAYRAVRWLTATVFDDQLPVPLVQWALTAYGKCLGMTATHPDDHVITLHPSIWSPGAKGFDGVIPGPRYTLDVVLHELMHVYVDDKLGGHGGGHSCHDNPQWCAAIEERAPSLKGTPLELPPFRAMPTKRRRVRSASGTRQVRRAPEGCLDMQAVSTWPSTLRDPDYYRDTTVPFEVTP